MDPPGLDERTLGRLIEVSRTLISHLDLESVLERVLDAARELTGARYAALGILDEGRRELERFLTLGIDEEVHAEIGDLPRGRGVLGELIAHPEPLRLRDVSQHPRSYGFPPRHPPMHTFLGVPIEIRGEAWGNLYLTEKAGGEEFDDADQTAVTILADWAAIAIENARLYEGLARRRDEVELQRDQAEHTLRSFEAMADIAQTVGGETRLDRILELIVKRGRALVEARTLMILLREGEELNVAAVAGEGGSEVLGAAIPLQGTRAGQVIGENRPERLQVDSEDDPQGFGRLGVGAETALLVPLTFRGTASGVLAAFDRTADGPDFGPEDERLLRSFAASAATAVATAKSVEVERFRHTLEAAEQERKRWARELHDQTLQALGGLRMLHSAALRSDASSEDLRRAVKESVELIDEEIESLSSLIVELRPAALDQIGLAPALRTLGERRDRQSDVSVDVLTRLGGAGADARLAPEQESMVYRLVQEALNNVVKHAGATRAEAVVERESSTVAVTVSDDGRGFDPEQVGNGFGLLGMRERVQMAGGDLTIESAPGEGTTVRARFPAQSAASSPLSST